MSRFVPVVVALLVVAAACKQQSAEPVPVAPPAEVVKQPIVSLDQLATDLPLVDLAGFISGEYHTSSNLPIVYRAGDKWIGAAKYPTNPIANAADFEQFLLENHYDANGKPGHDHMQHVTVNGSDMVVTTMQDLLPEMPADLRKHFSDAQYEALENARPRELVVRMAKRGPIAWTSSAGIEVVGTDGKAQAFPLAKAADAFAALALLYGAAR